MLKTPEALNKVTVAIIASKLEAQFIDAKYMRDKYMELV
jgi:hypothetical protein